MLRFYASILAFILSGSAMAKDLRYDVFEDWKAHGYVLAVEDTGPMSMQFDLQADWQDVCANAPKQLPRLGFMVEKESRTDGVYSVISDWKPKAIGGLTSILSGYDAVRVRIALSVFATGRNSRIQARMDLEVSDGQGPWRPETSTAVRDEIRQTVATMLFRPIYGDYPGPLNDYVPKYVRGDDPILTREQFWQTYSLPGFKALAPQAGSE